MNPDTASPADLAGAITGIQQPPTSTTNPDTMSASELSQSFYSPSVQKAESKLGNQNYHDLCERFVEENVYGHANMYATASDAWNNYVQNKQAYAGIQGAQPGSLLYFDDTHGGPGHAAIYMGDNKMISAEDTGIQVHDVSKWQQDTGQKLLGHVVPNTN